MFKHLSVLVVLYFFTINIVNSQTQVPDQNFEQALINLGLDDVLDGQVVTTNINTISELDISHSNISDITGIGDFNALEQLNVSHNNLTSLDLSNNTSLQILDCSYNNIFSLDFSNNPNLLDVDCRVNNLQNLNVTNNILLERLVCIWNTNFLGFLDVSNNSNLTQLFVNATNLSCVQVANEVDANNGNGIYANWSELPGGVYTEDCQSVQYTSIPDANFEMALMQLDLDNNLDGQAITSIIASVPSLVIHQDFLSSFEIGSISDLTGIEDFTALELLNVSGNALTALDLTENVNLEVLYCFSNNLINLNVPDSLIVLDCTFNELVGIDISQCNGLTELFIGHNNLLSLDVTQNTNLGILSFGFNQVSNLDVTQNTLLEHIYGFGNQLSGLNVTNNDILKSLWLENMPALSGTLDLSFNEELNSVRVYNTNLDCIQVANESEAIAGIGLYAGWSKDAATSYSEDCSEDSLSTNYNVLDEEILIYPNPTEGVQLFIKLGKDLSINRDNANTTLYSINGQIIFKDKSIPNFINVGKFNAGLYVLKIETENGLFIKKVIIR